MEFEPMLTPREKSPLPKMSPEEDRTRDAVDSEPKHYQLSYSGPQPTALNHASLDFQLQYSMHCVMSIENWSCMHYKNLMKVRDGNIAEQVLIFIFYS